jgi:small subunit ribosomal protein S3
MTSERKFIEENVKRVLLKEYLKRKTERSGFGGLDIQRTPMGTRVTLIAERPGMVIGRKGETIKELTEYVENVFKFDNPQIEVKEVSNPNLNPHIMAQKLANALERGWHFRRAGHSTVRRIMSAGAKGCQVIISGKLTGQRHRTEKFREGHIKYCGETKLIWMHEGYAVAKKKLGVIGVKVQIMDPNAKLPDDIEVLELKDVAEIKTVTAEGEVEIEQNVEPVTEIPEKETEVEGEVEGELEEPKTGKELDTTEPAKPTEPEPKMEPEPAVETETEDKKSKKEEPAKKGGKKKITEKKSTKKGKSTKAEEETEVTEIKGDAEKTDPEPEVETTSEPENKSEPEPDSNNDQEQEQIKDSDQALEQEETAQEQEKEPEQTPIDDQEHEQGSKDQTNAEESSTTEETDETNANETKDTDGEGTDSEVDNQEVDSENES